MLVLTRKLGEKIHFGDNIILTVLELRGNRVRLGVAAPADIRVLRAELNDFAQLIPLGAVEPREAEAVF